MEMEEMAGKLWCRRDFQGWTLIEDDGSPMGRKIARGTDRGAAYVAASVYREWGELPENDLWTLLT